MHKIMILIKRLFSIFILRPEKCFVESYNVFEIIVPFFLISFLFVELISRFQRNAYHYRQLNSQWNFAYLLFSLRILFFKYYVLFW